MGRFRIHRRGETVMMMDWNQYHKEVGSRLGEFMKLSPDTVRGYQMLSAAGSKTNHLDEKTRQLFSPAVPAPTTCHGSPPLPPNTAPKPTPKTNAHTHTP